MLKASHYIFQVYSSETDAERPLMHPDDRTHTIRAENLTEGVGMAREGLNYSHFNTAIVYKVFEGGGLATIGIYPPGFSNERWCLEQLEKADAAILAPNIDFDRPAAPSVPKTLTMVNFTAEEKHLVEGLAKTQYSKSALFKILRRIIESDGIFRLTLGQAI